MNRGLFGNPCIQNGLFLYLWICELLARRQECLALALQPEKDEVQIQRTREFYQSVNYKNFTLPPRSAHYVGFKNNSLIF